MQILQMVGGIREFITVLTCSFGCILRVEIGALRPLLYYFSIETLVKVLF